MTPTLLAALVLCAATLAVLCLLAPLMAAANLKVPIVIRVLLLPFWLLLFVACALVMLLEFVLYRYEPRGKLAALAKSLLLVALYWSGFPLELAE